MKYLFAILLTAATLVAAEAPISEVFPVGTSLTLKATADGSPTPTFQWRKDGVALAGATSDTLNITADQLTTGTYTVVATNPLGSATSPAYTLSIGNAPTTVSITVTVNVVVTPNARVETTTRPPSTSPSTKK